MSDSYFLNAKNRSELLQSAFHAEQLNRESEGDGTFKAAKFIE